MRIATPFLLLALFLAPFAAAEEKAPAKSVARDGYTLVVMDPLALPLSCPCVEGYAQRDYEKLAEFLSQELGKPVSVTFNESLNAALKKDTGGKADIVIGKHSVVLADAKVANLDLAPALALTGKDGQTQMTGLFVVAASDPATKVSDLKDYRIFFGGVEADEKYSAAIALLKAHNIAAPEKPETCQACSDGATKILELGKDVRAATVISSYAAPLLEGCGTIKKGDLRVIGTTAPVPFVEAFIAQSLPAEQQKKIEAALLKMSTKPELMKVMETKQGFVSLAKQKKS